MALEAAHISAVIAAMRADPARPFKTVGASRLHDVHPAVFIQCFRRLTGLTPKVFHSALRIERAKSLLEHSDLTLTEVGLEVGYDSHGSFSFIFRKMVGLTPRDFRRLTRGQPVAAVTSMIEQSQRDRMVPSAIRIAITGAASDQLIAVGLFGQAMPAGVPIDGFFVRGDSAILEFQWPPNKQCLHILAATDVTNCALCQGQGDPSATLVTLIARTEIHISSRDCEKEITLSLRPITPFDPPILLPVQLMLRLESRRREC